MKQVLMNDVHENEILHLKHLAIEHRRMMLELGHRQGIRLHYGAMFSMVEMVTVLYSHWMKVDPARPDWPERDRFVLSKGHGTPSLYAAPCLARFFNRSEFENFRRLDSVLQGHPDRNKTPGVDCCTGSLGQGFPVAEVYAEYLQKPLRRLGIPDRFTESDDGEKLRARYGLGVDDIQRAIEGLI